jgi:hypothetical protein
MADPKPIEISVASKEYLRVPFTANVDPQTVGVVEMAFTTARTAAEATWKTAAVVGDAVELLVGAGTTAVLAVGDYYVWVRIADTPEVPVELTGRVRIF